MESVPPASPDIDRAIRVFVHGFSFTRSLTHPYLAERVGPLWVMRDAPRRSESYRNEEWVAQGLPAEEIDRIAREKSRSRFSISVICGLGESQEPLRACFKALGYRLGTTESLMVHRLAQIPSFESPATIEQVRTEDEARLLSRANRKRPLSPEYFQPGSQLRQYMALVDETAAGWVQSIQVEDATWCENMYVVPSNRRRGIARAMLSQLLMDDRSQGSRLGVLLASHTGALLYPVVGYELIGALLLFHPGK